ncbi:alpha-N-acetylglucosaminidase [Macadamia integrifolia]|uniref:alpha-N-acetylglucosaminidase n=1 Tax=Macadamia integrifolia TaxID=60698 RepID=UPI001C4F33F4|nr:alpha-N-acetylglucosaminidase [Macadamia integrifolia]XP_042491728.1 alpha-N-acetylglucosaminidase [Macadamia integrifolia]XP_042491729.1 alpha-N-acetylglucosaminidase [Macadamia integrifolia]
MSHLRYLLLLFIILLPQASSEMEPIEGLLRRLDSKRAPTSVQEAAAKALLGRLLPTHVSSFKFKIVSKDACSGYSCFWINNFNLSSRKGAGIMIKGTTAVEMVSGLHWYLKYWCGAHVSWDKTGGTQIASIPTPGSLPVVKDGGVMIRRPVPWNYYQNVVTSSYSFVWWDWKRWEKEIDWMALQGVNLPLAFTGQEAIWQKVFKTFNITKEDLNDFFGGPAFLAWARMGNLHGWGGPLPQTWLDQQLALQKQILSRMIEFGMTPVLPSFSGNVPATLKRIFPAANITRLGNWNTINSDPRWCCTFLLDPSDPLFVNLGEAFIREQVIEYGDVTDIYNCDTFNENSPPTDNPAYISLLGAAVFKAMSKGDKDAVWLMQGWLFSSDSAFWRPPQMRALLHSVPFGKMIVLDLFADVKPIWENSSQFYGTPYVWCMLHNFGGNIEMYGRLDAISSGPVDARLSQNSTMVGVGMCMEGIEQNPVVYELMSEMAFRSEKVELEEWLRSYSRRRYGKPVYQIEEAWRILYRTIYNCSDGIADHNKDYIVELPDWDPSVRPDSNMSGKGKMHLALNMARRSSLREIIPSLPQPHLWYSTKEVIHALRLFLNAGNDLPGSFTYRYDLVDLTRQVLSKLANQVYMDAVTAFRQKDVKALSVQGERFIQIIKDIDTLLASDDNLLLGTWLESAKSLAVTPNELRQYEWNARTQITMWFDNLATNQSKLHDYANKFWGGLLENYYLPRASTYFSHLVTSLRENSAFKLEEWRREWISFSNKWQEGIELYPVEAQGDAHAIADALFKKYLS